MNDDSNDFVGYFQQHDTPVIFWFVEITFLRDNFEKTGVGGISLFQNSRTILYIISKVVSLLESDLNICAVKPDSPGELFFNRFIAALISSLEGDMSAF